MSPGIKMTSDNIMRSRYPAIHCWIKHILGGSYASNDKVLHTIFGKVRRVVIYATVIDKRVITSQNVEAISESGTEPKSRLIFELDDGTGIIRATIWEDFEKYSDIKKGSIVQIMGFIKQWRSYLSISPEVIKIVDDPNLILLGDAEIIKKLRSDNIVEVPEKFEEDLGIENLPDEFEFDDLFINDDDKEKIIEKIRELGGDREGIPYEVLKTEFKFMEEKLKKYLNDLEMESRIYQPKEKLYQLI